MAKYDRCDICSQPGAEKFKDEWLCEECWSSIQSTIFDNQSKEEHDEDLDIDQEDQFGYEDVPNRHSGEDDLEE